MEKITVCEISNAVIAANHKFLPVYAGVWLIKTNNDWTGYIDDDFPVDNLLLDKTIEGQIISVEVNSQVYTDVSREADPLDAIITTDTAFYFDQQNKALYIHFTDNRPPYYWPEDSIFIGAVLGFYKSTVDIDAYALAQNLAGNPYESRLLRSPTLKTTIDDFFYAKPVFGIGSITIDNSDLKYKNYFIGRSSVDNEIIGSKIGNYVRVMQWEGDSIANDLTYTDLQDNLIFQGFIEKGTEDYSGDQYKIILNVRDLRSSYNKKSPARELDNTQWPDLKDSERIKVLPHIWGDCLRVSCLCLNEDVTQTGSINYKFLLADSEKRNLDVINDVYLDGERLAITAPTILYDATQDIAYFEIVPATFLVDSNYRNMNKITVDVSGFVDSSDDLISNSLDIVSAILEDDQDILFNSIFYDLTQWNSVRNIAPNAGLYYDKPTKINKKISDVQKGLPATNWDLTVTRKQTWRNYRYDGSMPIFQIDEFMIPQGWGPNINTNSNEILASFRVGFQQKFGTDEKGEYNYSVNDDNLENALSEFRTDRSKDFETFISDTLIMADLQQEFLKLTKHQKDTLEIEIDSALEYNSIKASSLRAGDFIWLWANLEQELLYGRIVCQIISQENSDGKTKLILKIEYNATDNFVQKAIFGDGFGCAIGDGHGLYLGGIVSNYEVQNFTVDEIVLGDGTGQVIGDGNGDYIGGYRINE